MRKNLLVAVRLEKVSALAPRAAEDRLRGPGRYGQGRPQRPHSVAKEQPSIEKSTPGRRSDLILRTLRSLRCTPGPARTAHRPQEAPGDPALIVFPPGFGPLVGPRWPGSRYRSKRIFNVAMFFAFYRPLGPKSGPRPPS